VLSGPAGIVFSTACPPRRNSRLFTTPIPTNPHSKRASEKQGTPCLPTGTLHHQSPFTPRAQPKAHQRPSKERHHPLPKPLPGMIGSPQPTRQFYPPYPHMKTKLILSAITATLLTSCTYESPDTYNAPTKPIPNQKSPSNKNLRPTVKFPARIAIARVETNRYSTTTRLIEDRSYERPEHLAQIASMPNIRSIVDIDPGLIEGPATYTNIRHAARRLGCNMVAVYRFSTTHNSKDNATILSVATLGAAPTNSHATTTTVTLTIFDASNGYIYGVLQENATAKSLSSSWGHSESQNGLEQKTRQQAFDKLIKKLPNFWSTVTRK